ncbi:uncharacterized protein V6R79_022049 [Siganus canaliculatus]
MFSCGSLTKSLLVTVVVMVVVVESGGPGKLTDCCKTVSSEYITEPITGYLVQKAKPPCVRAVIFQTESGLFCSQVNAPWVLTKIRAFQKAKAQATAAPSSTVSLLSLITSTASPSPPSSSSSPLSPTSEPPAGESFSENKDE